VERLIEIHWHGRGDVPCYGDAIVEYTRYDEDGKIINEVLNVFLPEGIPTYQQRGCTTQAIEIFHRGL
jgi:hypothetical protein